MTAKFSEARKQAFLAALRATGNQTLAAEKAKVSRSWVRLQRSADVAFGRAVEEAVKEARAALRQARGERGGCNAPPQGWGFLDGVELVVRGTGGSGGGKRVQIARARLKQWSPRVEDRFLQVLAATCNVKAACAEVGMHPPSAYAHRKRWPAFARRWAEAVEIGYDRIEAGLIEAADNLFSNPEQPPEIAITGMTVDHAIHILHMHKNEVRGIGKRPGIGARPPRTLDAKMSAEIMRIFERVARMTDAELNEEQRESDRREWALRRGSGQARRARPGFGLAEGD